MLAERYLTTLIGRTTPEQNEQVVRRAFAAMTAGPDTWIAEHDELFGPDLVGHFAGMPPIDSRTHLEFGLATFEAFSDVERLVEDVVAEGDKVVARWVSRGTHTGSFQGIPATGRYVSTSGITIFRLEAGRIVEEWSETDMPGLLQQLGALPGSTESA
jgi:steroid delta-isomerase-like uncharacterized protein